MAYSPAASQITQRDMSAGSSPAAGHRPKMSCETLRNVGYKAEPLQTNTFVGVPTVRPRIKIHCPKLESIIVRAPQNPESHLERVRQHLALNTVEALFYAALEFRFCVEARLHHYAEQADKFATTKGNVWKAKDLAKHVDRVFGSGDNVYSIEMSSPTLPEPVTIEYVPVTTAVRSILGKVDNFLHYAGVLQCYLENKENDLRTLLECGVREMEACLAGGLQGSLVKDATGHVQMSIDLDKYPELRESLRAGDCVNIRVEITPYLK